VESLVSAAAAFFRGRRVLVTGAAGFIGRRLTEVLAVAGADLSVLEIPSADLTSLRSLSDQGLPLRYLSADLCIRGQVVECLQSSQPEFVFHLAAAGVGNPFLPLDQALAVNLHGTVNLLDACFDNGADVAPMRLVHTGTPYEYGNGRSDEPFPINPYAASKAAVFAVARMFQRTRQWPIVTVRPFQVYGPNQPARSLIPAALHAALAGKTFDMTGGEQERDMIFLDDVVRGYLLAAAHGQDGCSYDLGWGESLPVRDVIRLLFELLDVDAQLNLGALPYRPGEIWNMQANPASSRADLGWQARIVLREGLQRTIRAFSADQ
jgi:UDP-glucose 4-epimerase